MSHNVHVWIVEAKELHKTDFTCVPRTLPPGAEMGSYAWFDSKYSFLMVVRAALREMPRADDRARNLLVISAHGREKSGTYLKMAKDVAMSPHEAGDTFSIRPPALMVLVSACWGGYPSVIEMLRGRGDSEHSLIVAPVVSVEAPDINAVQAEIISAMVQEDDVDNAVEDVVRRHDKRLRPKYAEAVLRVIRRDGTMNPSEGEGGLAAVMEQPASYRVVALQKLASQGYEPPGIAILQAPDKTFWRISTASIFGAVATQNYYDMLGKVVTLRAKNARYSEEVELGEFVDAVALSNPAKAKAPPVLPAPYAHCGERTYTKKVAEARPIDEHSLRRCKRCNWASYRFVSVKRNGITKHQVDAICHRDQCDEHGKWT